MPVPWTERQREERELMGWFRDLPAVQQRLVSIEPRLRGWTRVRPRRRVPSGRNVHCAMCPQGRVEPVWFTNEPGDKGRRAAQLAAARHLQRHMRGEVNADA